MRSRAFCKVLSQGALLIKTKLHSKNQRVLTNRLSVNESKTHLFSVVHIRHIFYGTYEELFSTGEEQNWSNIYDI